MTRVERMKVNNNKTDWCSIAQTRPQRTGRQKLLYIFLYWFNCDGTRKKRLLPYPQDVLIQGKSIKVIGNDAVTSSIIDIYRRRVRKMSLFIFFAAICLLIPCHQKNGIYFKKYIHPEVRFSIRRHSKEENASESTSRCPATLPSILSIVFQTPLSINRERRVCLHMGFTGFLVYWESVGGRKSDCGGSVGVKTNRPCIDYD